MPLNTEHTSSGFTLVELAVSLVVIGLLLGLGMTMVGPLMTSIKVRESKENLGASVESLNSYASGNNRLPDAAGFPAATRAPQDAWGRDLLYLFDNNLFSAAPTKDTICGRRSTPISLVTTDPAATIPNVAYLIISPGDDATVQATLAGTLNGAASGPAIAVNTRGFITGTITLDAQNSDLIRWVTLDELRTKVGCQGAQLKIVNNELPYGYAESAYPTVTIALDGGATPGTYRWCIESPGAVPLPAGLAFTTTTPALPIRVTPADSCTGYAEANWGVVTAAPNLLTISGTPAASTQGAYSFTVYVRDNNDATGDNDNVAQKAFALTINPKL